MVFIIFEQATIVSFNDSMIIINLLALINNEC